MNITYIITSNIDNVPYGTQATSIHSETIRMSAHEFPIFITHQNKVELRTPGAVREVILLCRSREIPPLARLFEAHIITNSDMISIEREM